MPKPTYDQNAKVRLTNDSPISNNAKLAIGDLLIPIYEATVHIAVGEFVTITAVAKLDYLDIQAFQEDTRIVIENREEENGDEATS